MIGYCGLGTCVSSLGLGTAKPINVDIVVRKSHTQPRRKKSHAGASSQRPSLTPENSVRVWEQSTLAWSKPCITHAKVSLPYPPWLQRECSVSDCRPNPLGDVGMKEYTERTTRKASATGPSQTLRDHLRIYFPTDQTIGSSRGGRGVSSKS